MSDQSFEKDLFVQNLSDATNSILDSTDLRTNCSSTTLQGEDYLEILNTLSNIFPVDEATEKEISSDLLSEKIEKPKIWSVSDILGNSTNTCSNEISSSPVGELHEEPNCVPAHSSVENQVIPGNYKMNPSNTSNNQLNANNCIGNQAQPNMSIPIFDPTIASLGAMGGSDSSTVRGVWMENGTEYLMLPGGENCQWYMCNFCNIPFHDKKALYYHQYVAHVINQVIYRCPLCGENYWTNESLQVHLHERHPNQCLFCRIQFATSTHLTNHILLCHSNTGLVPPRTSR